MMNTQAKTFVRSQLFPEEMPQFLEKKASRDLGRNIQSRSPCTFSDG